MPPADSQNAFTGIASKHHFIALLSSARATIPRALGLRRFQCAYSGRGCACFGIRSRRHGFSGCAQKSCQWSGCDGALLMKNSFCWFASLLMGSTVIASLGLSQTLAVGTLSILPLGPQALSLGIIASFVTATFGTLCCTLISRTPGEVCGPRTSNSVSYAALCADLVFRGGPGVAIGEVIAGHSASPKVGYACRPRAASTLSIPGLAQPEYSRAVLDRQAAQTLCALATEEGKP
jgi:hypothetical protein